MSSIVELRWAKGAQKKITKEVPDNIVHGVARMTLDLVITSIPERTGKMRRSTSAGGVRGGNGEYHIGSYTNYAKYVYVKDNNKTHWTTPGTNSYWFKEYWQKHGRSILSTVIKENK